MVSARVTAALCSGEYGAKYRALTSGEMLQLNNWIEFDAVNLMGATFLTDFYKVRWRVTNTDKVASYADALRGNFYLSDTGGTSRREYTSYRGVHFVEAFVIRKRDSKLSAKSEPFYVVIE
ncbi:MAG: hypothetical protein EOP06_18915 [Proteobacteria bacterium]|nr:MAG: hypothetical protein EOP06_18915 [Pseudomonadota bacterium]